jgi:hypothetical protein
MSQYQKLSQKILNNLLLTPVDGYSTRINTDNEECEISFEFGGLKGIMEEMDREEPVLYNCYEDGIFSTKSSSPDWNSYLKNEKIKLENILLHKTVVDIDPTHLEKIQNACENQRIPEISNFNNARALNLIYSNFNPVSQPIRRKKIKISQILKKKWKTKVPSFVENQKTKLISKINLIKNQNINKYKNDNHQKMSTMNNEEKFLELKANNRRCIYFFNFFLVSHNVPKKEVDMEIFNRKSSKSQKYMTHSNKFNTVEVADFERMMYLNNRLNLYEHNRPYFISENNLQMKNHSVNNNNSVNFDHFSNDVNSKYYSSKNFSVKNCN